MTLVDKRKSKRSVLGFVLVLLVVLSTAVLATSVSAQGPTITGHKISGSNFNSFVAEDTPLGASCAWAVGVKNLTGAPRVPTCLKFEATQEWSGIFWFNSAYADSELSGADHAALYVDGGGSVTVEFPGYNRTIEWSGKVIGIGLYPGNIMKISFDPQGSKQIVWWGSDPMNSARYGASDHKVASPTTAAAIQNIRWLSNEVEPGWFSIVSEEYRRDHIGQDCAWSILFKNVHVQSGRQVPMSYCGLWTLQAGDPINTISGLFSAQVKAGPNYNEAVHSITEPGLASPQVALWLTGGDFEVTVRWTDSSGNAHEQSFEVNGTSRGIAFKPGDPDVYFKITALKIGSRALLEWGPDYGPWWAEFGPSGSYNRAGG